MSEIQDEPKPKRISVAKPSRRATIMRGVVAPIFGLLAVMFIVLGALNATVWKSRSEVTASVRVTQGRYVVTDPGVLGLVDRSVSLRVAADASGHSKNEQKAGVCLAFAAAKDVAGWLDGQAYTRISGLRSWSKLATTFGKVQRSDPAEEPQGGVAFRDSDMWSSVSCGTQGAQLTAQDVADGQVAVIDLQSAQSADTAQSKAKADKSRPATVTMHWTRQSVPDFAWPFYIAAAVCVLLTVLAASVLAMGKWPHRRGTGDNGEAKPMPEVPIGQAVTGSITVLRESMKHMRPRAAHSARNHANHSGRQASAPTIIDPSQRNMLLEGHAGDQQTGGSGQAVAEGLVGGADGDKTDGGPAHGRHGSDAFGGSDAAASADSGEATTVIAPDELAAFIARFTEEGQADPGSVAEAAAEEPEQPGSGDSDAAGEVDVAEAGGVGDDGRDDASGDSDGTDGEEAETDDPDDGGDDADEADRDEAGAADGADGTVDEPGGAGQAEGEEIGAADGAGQADGEEAETDDPDGADQADAGKGTEDENAGRRQAATDRKGHN